MNDPLREDVVVGPILLNKEMAIKVAGLAQHADSEFVFLTQTVPKDRSLPRALPVNLARSNKRTGNHEWWEITMERGGAVSRFLSEEARDEPS